jgi:polysaccharide transporter, PST family
MGRAGVWSRAVLEKGRALSGHVVVRNAALMYLVQFSGYLFPLITLPYLSRVLSPQKFGLIAFAQVFIWYFMNLTEYGFNLTATRAVAVVRDKPEEVSRIFGAVMVAKVMLTALGLLLLVITVGAVPTLRPDMLLYLVAFLSVVGNMLFPLWLFQGLQKMEHVAVRDFLSKLLSLLFLFSFVRGDEHYLLAAAAQSGGLLLGGVLSLLTVWRRLGVRFVWPRRADVWEQLRVGWPAFLSLAASTSAGVTNTFILGLRASTVEVAYLTAPQRIISTVRSLVVPLSTAIYPHVSQKAARSESEAIAFVAKYQYLLAVPFLMLGGVLVVGAPWIVALLFGKAYGPAVPVLQVMAFIPALAWLSQVYSTYYMLACGYDRDWMRILLKTVAINFVVLLPALYFLRGSMAIAVTSLAVDGAAAGLYWMFYHQRSRQVLERVPAEVS